MSLEAGDGVEEDVVYSHLNPAFLEFLHFTIMVHIMYNCTCTLTTILISLNSEQSSLIVHHIVVKVRLHV